jgi:hypothetical protein
MADIAAAEASVVVTANSGCVLQREWGARRSGLVAQAPHLSELLDAAPLSSERREG